MCGAWTNPKYRGQGLANMVNNQLFKNLKPIKKNIHSFALLTLEGNEAAYNLYKKLGYTKIDGEASILGDIVNTSDYHVRILKQSKTQTAIYSSNTQDLLSITYSIDQLFAHPKNLSGTMIRIIKIEPLKQKLNKEELYNSLQAFFSANRFCKLNINELVQNNQDKKQSLFYQKLKDYLYQFEFLTSDNSVVKITPTDKVMKKELQLH